MSNAHIQARLANLAQQIRWCDEVIDSSAPYQHKEDAKWDKATFSAEQIRLVGASPAPSMPALHKVSNFSSAHYPASNFSDPLYP